MVSEDSGCTARHDRVDVMSRLFCTTLHVQKKNGENNEKNVDKRTGNDHSINKRNKNYRKNENDFRWKKRRYINSDGQQTKRQVVVKLFTEPTRELSSACNSRCMDAFGWRSENARTTVATFLQRPLNTCTWSVNLVISLNTSHRNTKNPIDFWEMPLTHAEQHFLDV